MSAPQITLAAVVGATATGKTAVGMELAERIGGEIVSADAVAVYRGLDIGAAKPMMPERARIPFHLVDVVDPDTDFTVAEFERLADEAIGGIRGRGHFPLLVGGSGLYIRSVTATLTIPAVPPQTELREALWKEAEEQGAPRLHERLARVDAPGAAKILPNDAKRIIRALEVWHVTGQPMSSFHTDEGVQGIPKAGVRVFGLSMDREGLYRRIEERVDAMLSAGLLDEVRGLLDAGYAPELKSMQSLGYRQMAAFLAGTIPYEQAVLEMKRDTRRFARRQLMWFRADKRIEWMDMEDSPARTADRIYNALKSDIL